MARTRRGKTRGSITASLLGLIVFLVGVAMLVFTFKLAYDMFMVPPQEALGIKPKQPLDLGQAGQSFVREILKVIFLIVMGLMGSLIANRGVSLFTGSRAHPQPKATPVRGDTVESNKGVSGSETLE